MIDGHHWAGLLESGPGIRIPNSHVPLAIHIQHVQLLGQSDNDVDTLLLAHQFLVDALLDHRPFIDRKSVV